MRRRAFSRNGRRSEITLHKKVVPDSDPTRLGFGKMRCVTEVYERSFEAPLAARTIKQEDRRMAVTEKWKKLLRRMEIVDGNLHIVTSPSSMCLNGHEIIREIRS